MNIDQRLDRLTERHEALTQSVEIISHQITELREGISELREVALSLIATAKQDGENIRSLARTAEAHERRIGDLEAR